jgi:hypothetical protein
MTREERPSPSFFLDLKSLSLRDGFSSSSLRLGFCFFLKKFSMDNLSKELA